MDMPTDLELIKELEKEIGIELTEEEKIDYARINEGVYQRGHDGNVIRLALEFLKLKKFPSTILKFKDLDFLSLLGNQLNSVPPEISQLMSLMELSLGYNQLGGLPPEITQLTNLSALSLKSNQLCGLPSGMSQLTNLKTLDMSVNQLSELPSEITQLTSLTALYLDGNLLKQPPPEIVNQGILAVLEYYSQFANMMVNEAKLILVGQGDVGKTCLTKRLMDDEFIEVPTTEGIDILCWDIKAPTQEHEKLS